jgi:uncharacterized protein (TIGR02646 family)
MIRLRRDRQDSKGALICPTDSWEGLAKAALADALREAAAHEARREVYGHDWVRAALEALFHDKCAYCETKITGGTDWEVEHFRPKARVAERLDHPGYFWLAYEWSNLYPSCTLCNQRRRDRPRWGDCSLAGTGGKGDQFPLVDEGERAMSPHDDLDREKPLLLDPCRDNPDRVLSYNLLGEIIATGDHPRAKATIAIFHLDRRRLRDLRGNVVAEVVGALAILGFRRGEISDEARAEFLSWLQRHHLNDSCEYAAVARAILRDPVAFGLPQEAVSGLSVGSE